MSNKRYKSRYTVIMDPLVERVILLYAKKRNQTISSTINNILHMWIQNNTHQLKKKYNIDIKELLRDF